MICLSYICYYCCQCFLATLARRKRPNYAVFVHFTAEKVPTEPNPSAVEVINRKRVVADSAVAKVKRVNLHNVLFHCNMTVGFLIFSKKQVNVYFL